MKRPGFLQWWSGFVWRGQGLESLAFDEPQHEGTPLDQARQIYHRLVVQFAAMNGYRRQWQVLGLGAALWIGSWFIPHAEWGVFWGLWSFVGALFLSCWLVPRMMRGTADAEAKGEAEGIVRRCFLRDVDSATPDDLRDVWRHGWLTSQGRPISSEICEADAREVIVHEFAKWWLVSAAGLAAGIACWSGIEFMGTLALVAIVGKLLFHSNPATRRELLLSIQEGVEGLAFVAAGGDAWGQSIERARIEQIKEAKRDADKVDGRLVRLGDATGLLAARGDMFAPSAGMPFSLSLRDLQTHLLVLGGTGSGKTTAVLKPLIYQAAAWDGIGLAVMDGKGALPGELRKLGDKLTIIDPDKVRVSLVAGIEPSMVVDTLVEILGGQSSDRFWSDSAGGILRRCALVAHAAGKGEWSLLGAARLAFDDSEREKALDAVPAEALAESPALGEAMAFLETEFPEIDPKLRSNFVAQIRSWINTLTAHPKMLAWADATPSQSEADIGEVLKGARMGVLIPAHRYGDAGRVASALLKARLYRGLKDRADDKDWRKTGTPVLMVIDEAQEVATADDATLLAIGRSLGLAMVAATQTIEGVYERLGQASAKWLGIFGGVVGLTGRSEETDKFVAHRIGAAWSPYVEAGNGLPVKTAIQADMMTGPHAAKRTQKFFGKHLRSDNWNNLVYRATRGVAGQIRALFQGQAVGAQASCRLGVRGMVEPGEIQTLLAEPNRALAIVSRARVIRRDAVTLFPDFD